MCILILIAVKSFVDKPISMALFSLAELNKLSHVRSKYELSTNEYLNNPQNENFRFVSKQYFDNNSNDTKLFNT